MQKKKNPRKGWVNWRNYKMSLIKVDKLDKVLVYAHEKDVFENTKKTWVGNPRITHCLTAPHHWYGAVSEQKL